MLDIRRKKIGPNPSNKTVEYIEQLGYAPITNDIQINDIALWFDKGDVAIHFALVVDFVDGEAQMISKAGQVRAIFRHTSAQMETFFGSTISYYRQGD